MSFSVIDKFQTVLLTELNYNYDIRDKIYLMFFILITSLVVDEGTIIMSFFFQFGKILTSSRYNTKRSKVLFHFQCWNFKNRL